MTDPVGSVIPWEQRGTAVAAGFDPYSVTPVASRRRAGDAGHGRTVTVPVYLRTPDGSFHTGGLLVRLGPRGVIGLDPGAYPPLFGDEDRFWRGVHAAGHDPRSLRHRDGWVRVALGSAVPGEVALVLRDADWALLCAALDLRSDIPAAPQDADHPHTLARYLGRLDGADGTAASGLWGRLALEVVSVRHPGRLAATRSLRWHASWGVGGFPAGSSGRAQGWAGSPMLLDLRHQQVVVDGRPFRVRSLPDWERQQAAADLGMPPARLLAWPVAPLPQLLAWFDDIAPGVPSESAPQDAVVRPEPGPQDVV